MNQTVKISILSVLLSIGLGCGNTGKEPSKEKLGPAKPTTPAPKEGNEPGANTSKTEPKEGDSPDEPHAAGTVAATGDHAHESPHGGKVATSGDKHLELKITDDGHIDVFVLDGNTKPMSSKGAQGKVKVTLPEGIKEFPLTYDEKGDHLTAMAPKITTKKLVALVDLTIEGKPYSARFDYEFAPHSH